ncbi:MAG: hypothetical protein PHE51_04890 [Eubacteriales bacterium]|nr:hypothetical protein [Eubacteriales bacterium]
MASANTLTNLIPDIFAALDVVSRELSGFIPAVSINSSLDQVDKAATIRIPNTSKPTPVAITPASYAPDTGGQTIGHTTMTVDQAYSVPVQWTGEEEKGFSRTGLYENIRQQQFAQGIRALINAIETDIAELYTKSSRAYGTAGTTPFASNLDDVNQLRKILMDNGAQGQDLSLVVNTTAGVNLRNLVHLTQVNTAGSDMTLRNGVLLPISGFNVYESAYVQSHTAGAGTGYDINGTEAVGQTTLTLEGGTVNVTGITAGDVITFAGGANAADANKYIVTTGTTSTSGDIVIASPGLIIAKDTNDELTIGSSYTANMGFARSAIVLATRMPMRPSVGDMADDIITITDPITGISFEIAMYKGYHQVHYEVGIVWGCQIVKPEHCAILLG